MQEAFNKATDLLGRIDTQRLYPAFLERLNTLLNNCAARGQLYVATSGFRSHAEQDALYAQGYIDPKTGKWRGPTKARGGKSAHNFGIAVDFAPHMSDSYVGKLILGPKDDGYAAEYYTILDEETEKLGLEWGGRWASFEDTPHVQWKLPNGLSLSDLDKTFRKNGIVSETWLLL